MRPVKLDANLYDDHGRELPRSAGDGHLAIASASTARTTVCATLDQHGAITVHLRRGEDNVTLRVGPEAQQPYGLFVRWVGGPGTSMWHDGPAGGVVA